MRELRMFEDFIYDLFEPVISTMEYKIYTDIDDKYKRYKIVESYKNKNKEEAKKSTAKTTEKKTKLSPPWQTVYKKFIAMFKGDTEIKIFPIEDSSNGEKILYIDTPNGAKAYALSRILKTSYNFGNVNLKIKIRVTNGNRINTDAENLYDLYIDALAGTPAVVDVVKAKRPTGEEFTAVIFKKEVVQFFNDDLTDFYGNWNGVYTDIATDIFKYDSNVMYTIEE